jgi:hypothetical protein
MASTLPIAAQDTIHRIQRIQAITIVWMSVEAAVSLSAAWIAHSPSLLAFGGDSAIELLSAIVVLWRFRGNSVQEHAERRASRIAGILLFALATYVVGASSLTLLGYTEAKPSYIGIGILIAAAVIMPWLAREKRRLSSATGSSALRADSVQSALCAYLSLVGDPNARSVKFFLDSAIIPIYLMGDGLLPADIDGRVPDNNGNNANHAAPIVGTMDDNFGYGAPFDGLNVSSSTCVGSRRRWRPRSFWRSSCRSQASTR